MVVGVWKMTFVKLWDAGGLSIKTADTVKTLRSAVNFMTGLNFHLKALLLPIKSKVSIKLD